MTTMPPVHVEIFRIRHSDGDRNGVLKFRPLFDVLQEAAANHASELSVGMEDFQARGMIWVLSSMRLRWKRPLKIGEELTVETYPTGFYRLYAVRQFRLLDRAGECVMFATSFWLMLSPSLRPLRPTAENLPLPDNSGKEAFFAEPPRPGVCEGAPLFGIRVGASRIDVNGHMNNAEYAALVQDALPLIGWEQGSTGELQIRFVSAAKEGEELHVCARRDGDSFLVCGRGGDGTVRFECSGCR